MKHVFIYFAAIILMISNGAQAMKREAEGDNLRCVKRTQSDSVVASTLPIDMWIVILEAFSAEELLALRAVNKEVALAARTILNPFFSFAVDFKTIASNFTDKFKKGSSPEIAVENLEYAAQALIDLRKSAREFISKEQATSVLERFKMAYFDNLSSIYSRPRSLLELEFKSHPEHWPLLCVIQALGQPQDSNYDYLGNELSPLLMPDMEISQRLKNDIDYGKVSVETLILAWELIDRNNMTFDESDVLDTFVFAAMAFVESGLSDVPRVHKLFDFSARNSEKLIGWSVTLLIKFYGIQGQHDTVIALYEKHSKPEIDDMDDEIVYVARAYVACNEVEKALAAYAVMNEFYARYLKQIDRDNIASLQKRASI
jgi:hypothetical protein